MKRYPATILFTLAVGMAGGYAIGVMKAREEANHTVAELERTVAHGVLINDSSIFAFLARHLHERGVLVEDPETVATLRIALGGVVMLDSMNQLMFDKGQPAPRMFEDTRQDVEEAFTVLQSYPVTESENDGEQGGASDRGQAPSSLRASRARPDGL